MTTPELPDEQLLLRFISEKNQAAFQQLVARHSRLVFGVCQRVLCHHHDAEDAFQKTFVTLARSAQSVRCPTSLPAWLYGTAYRISLSVASRRRHIEPLCSDSLPAAGESVLSKLTWQRDQQMLDEELCKLPRSYRQVVVLRYLDGKSTKAVATELMITPGAVKGRLERAKQLLRRRLILRGVGMDELNRAVAAQQSARLPPSLVETTTATACQRDQENIIRKNTTDRILALVLRESARSLSSVGLRLAIGASALALSLLLVVVQISQPSSAQAANVPLEQPSANPNMAGDTKFKTLMVAETDANHGRQAQARELTETRKRTINGINANYSALASAVATIQTTFIDYHVQRETTRELKANNGAVLTITERPVTINTNVVTLRGTNFRSDPVVESPDKAGSVWTFTNGIWSQYLVASDRAYIRKTDQLPGMFPLDPRNIGSTEIREPLLDRLQQSKLVSQSKQGDRLELLWEWSNGPQKGRQYRTLVAPEMNHLPTKFEYLDDDDKPYVTIEISYQQVSDHVWFLREAQTQFHRSSQQMKIEVLGKPQIDAAIPDKTFRIAYPIGTEIRDSARAKIYRIK